MANLENMRYSEKECMADATDAATAMLLQGVYAKAGCFKIGESV